MKTDDQAIRELVSTWLDACKRGDLDTVLDLMEDDVVFIVPGQEPFGKDAWRKRMNSIRVEGRSEIQEIKVSGEWAWMRQRLRVTVALPNGTPRVLSGYTLAILHKRPGGKWVLARDANLVMPESELPG